MPKAIAIVGPTATGKTIIGAKLAQHAASEVISVDSQLVYEELSIGVAKPTTQDMQGVPHHMISIVPPTFEFSAGHYVERAFPILEHLQQQHKTPFLVGGTGFYLRALLQPEHIPHIPTNRQLRAELQTILEEEGSIALHHMLKKRDPNRATQIHPNDTVRLMRALEIIEATGQPISSTPLAPRFPVQFIGLTYQDRDRHIHIIRERLNTMLKEGFMEEAEAVYQKYGFCHALQKAHGYPELIQVLNNHQTLPNAVEQIEINIRQYSRRQMTWFKTIPGIHWYAVDAWSPEAIVSDVLQKYLFDSPSHLD